MGKVKTVYQYAKELVSKYGKEYAIAEFKKRIEALGEPNADFGKICKLSAYETALDCIENDFK